MYNAVHTHRSKRVGHSNKVKLRRARLVLGLVTLSQQTTQYDHPSVGGCNEYWRWCRSPLEKKRRALHSSGPCSWDC